MEHPILLFKFAHRYEVELLNELPGDLTGIEHLYFPGASNEGGRDGLLLEVSAPNRSPWLGTFAFGYPSSVAANVIASCPNENSLAVISSGLGVIVDARNPLVWEEAKGFPVIDVKAVVERSLLLFVDFTMISAYGAQGWIWTTARLSTDELKIKQITPEYALVSGWNAERQQEVSFRVYLDSGSHEDLPEE